MASHTHHTNLDNERTRLPAGAKTLGLGLMAGGLVALVLAVILTFALGGGDHHGGAHAEHETPVRRFFFSYLFGIAPFLALSCAALIFTLVHHLVKAGWVINVRRVQETFAAQLPLLSLLLIPIIGTVIWQKGTVYSWAVPTSTEVVHHGGGHHDAHDEHGHAGHHAGETPEEHAKHVAEATTHGAATTTTAADAHKDDHKDDHKGEQPKHAHTGADMHAADAHAKPGEPSVAHDADAHKLASDRNVTQSPESREVYPRGPLPAQEYPNEQVKPGVARAFDAIIKEKNSFWLHPILWSFRIPLYLIVVSAAAWYYHKQSVAQDATGDIDISSRLMTLAAPLTMATALIVTFIAFDVFMSLDPHWFSTMFGVYFFASGAQAMWAATAITLLILQSRGYLRESVSREHFHDMGKWMWAFIFFFAYIAFSQYMLQWYANLPEETFWFDKRGYSTQRPNGYSILVLALLIGRLVIPFPGLLSRHVKRNRFGLGFWAVWLLAMLFIDMYLLVMPEYKWVDRYQMFPFGPIEILCLLGVAGLWVGNVVRMLASHALRPLRDPRVHESLAVVNF